MIILPDGRVARRCIGFGASFEYQSLAKDSIDLVPCVGSYETGYGTGEEQDNNYEDISSDRKNPNDISPRW